MFEDYESFDDYAVGSILRRPLRKVESCGLALPRLEVPSRQRLETMMSPDFVFRCDAMVLLESAGGLRFSVRVANETQCVGLKAELFIPRLVESELTERDVAVLLSEGFLERLVLVMPLRLKTCSPANRIVFDVENMTEKTCVFDGALFGVTVR